MAICNDIFKVKYHLFLNHNGGDLLMIMNIHRAATGKIDHVERQAMKCIHT